MAWIYLAASEELPSHSMNGSDQSPIVKTTDTAMLCFCLGCDSANFLVLPSGTILQASELPCCPDMRVSISSMGDSPVRTLAVRDLELAWKESEVGCSLKSSDSLANCDPDSFSWKTSQLSLFGGLTEFFWSSLRWGSIVAGRLYQPQRLEPVTYERDGFFLPTPTAQEYGNNQTDSPNAKVRPSLSAIAKSLPTPMARDWKGAGGKNRNSIDLPRTMGGSLNPQFVEEIMGYQIAWTESAHWAMQWFHSKRKQHSKDLSESRTPND